MRTLDAALAAPQTWNPQNCIDPQLPPEIFFVWEMSSPPEIDAFHNIVVAAYSLDPPPKIIPLEFVLVAQLQHARLQGYNLLNGKGLPDAVGKLKLSGYALDVHIWYQLYKASHLI